MELVLSQGARSGNQWMWNTKEQFPIKQILAKLPSSQTFQKPSKFKPVLESAFASTAWLWVPMVLRHALPSTVVVRTAGYYNQTKITSSGLTQGQGPLEFRVELFLITISSLVPQSLYSCPVGQPSTTRPTTKRGPSRLRRGGTWLWGHLLNTDWRSHSPGNSSARQYSYQAKSKDPAQAPLHSRAKLYLR